MTPPRLKYNDLMAMIARCKTPFNRKPRTKWKMPVRHPDPWPLRRHHELRLYREIFRCWDEIAKVKGKLATTRIDLRAAQREAKKRRLEQGSLFA